VALPGRKSKCGYKGVYFHAASKKWAAQIRLPIKHIGLFRTAKEAAKEYDKVARKAGVKILNFVDPND
jgi:hypothetical protein